MTQTPHAGQGEANRMAARLAPFWSAEKVRAELELDHDELLDAIARSAVLGLETSDRVLVFPVAQFERLDGRTVVRPAIAAMLAELTAGDRWSVALLLTGVADELGAKSPYAAEREGVPSEELVEYARLVNREWAL